MDASTDREEGLAKSINLGVGALVVLACAAVVAGAVWYFQRNALPTCGSPEATGLVLNIISENFAKDLTADEAATMAKSVKLSLDLVEKGELSADGNVRKCSAQLAATLSPDIKAFVSKTQADGFDGIRKEADDKFSIPVDYELKALDGQSSKFLASVPGSLPAVALRGAVTLLAKTYEPPTPVRLPTPVVETASVSPTAAANESPAASSVASFDCGKATTTVEKTICADPALSALDGRMATLYAAARKNLDAKFIGQAKWLKEERDRCGGALNAGATPTSCLTITYTDRIGELESFSNDILYQSTANPDFVIEFKPLAGQNQYQLSAMTLDDSADYCLLGGKELVGTIDPERMVLSANDDQDSIVRIAFGPQYSSLTVKTEGGRFCYGSMFTNTRSLGAVEPTFIDGSYQRISALGLK